MQFVARECLDDLLVNHRLVSPTRTRTRWLLEALFYVAVTAAVSITEPKLTDILDVISTLFATVQVAALPALLIWHIYAPSPPHSGEALTTSATHVEEEAGTPPHPPPAARAAALTGATECDTSPVSGCSHGPSTLNSRLLDPMAPSSAAAMVGANLGALGGADARAPLEAAVADASSYYSRAACRMSPRQLRGLPRLSSVSAGVIATLYAGLALASAALYYATISVQPAAANATAAT